MLQNIKPIRNPIGAETIYIEAQQAAIDILNEFSEHQVCPLLISHPQQGKTAVQIAVADSFIETCKANNETYQVILILNMSDTSLLSQTKSRFRESGLVNIDFYHHPSLNKIPIKDVDKRLIIIDECHFALGKDRPFDMLLKKSGIQYGKPISTWINKNNYVLSVSATPYATVIREQIDKVNNTPTFRTITLKQSRYYFSLIDIIRAHRIKSAESLLDKNNVSQYFKDRFDEFINICNDPSIGKGYLIIRAKGDSCRIVKDFCNKKGIHVETYSSSKKDEYTIEELDSNISNPVIRPVVIIIKGALRAGKTLTTTKHIRMWLESESSTSDSIAQVIGRCCGYADKKYNHSKFKDTFNIYCDLLAVEKAAQFYNYDFVPKGLNNKSNYEEKRIFDFKEVNDSKDVPKGITDSVGTISGNKELDIALAIYEGRCPSAKSRAWHIDSPYTGSNFNGIDSYNKLLLKYPNCQGKIIYAEESNLTKIVSNSEDKISPKSLMRK
jgi:hypothetical protein